MDDLTIAEADVIRRLFTHYLRHTQCWCHMELAGKPICDRCKTIFDLKDTFPEVQAAGLQIFTLMTNGPRA